MAKFFQRRVRVLLAASLAGFGLWKAMPETPVLKQADRLAFRSVAGAFANPPFFISGDGSHQQPWGLRTLATPDPRTKLRMPAVLGIEDDPDGKWQSSPPSPADYAVIFRNLKAAGVRHLAVGSVVAWSAPDPFAKEAFFSRLKDFDSVVMVTPLSRSSTEDRMPAAFIRSSLAVDQVRGDAGMLPVVNHLPVPGTFLGDARTLAGFSELESETPTENRPLLARWGDRVVFAFPVVAAMAEKGLSVEGVDLRLGSYLKLGPEGPVVPIDGSGRMTLGLRSEKPVAVPVDSLLDPEPLALDQTALLRDDRLAADKSTQRFSASVASAMAAIRSDAGLSSPKQFFRLPEHWEEGVIGLLVVLLVAAAASGTFRLKLFFGILVGVVATAQLLAMAFGIWLPGLVLLGTVLAGYLAAWPFAGRASAQEADLPVPLMPEAPVAPQAVDSSPAFAPEIQEPLSSAPAVSLEKPVPARKAAKKAAKPVAPESTPPAVEPSPAMKPVRAPKPEKSPAAPAKKAAKKAAKKTPKKKK